MFICCIPARKGSKGLVNKNIYPLNNKPLIQYTVEASIQSQLFDRIVVTTDDSRIISLVKNLNYYNVTVINRPKFLSTDTVPLTPVVVHAVKSVEKLYGKVTDICTLQPTSPLRTSNHIFEAYCRYRVLRGNSLVSVTEEEHNLYKQNKLNKRYAVPVVYHKVNRQQVNPLYTGNGAISICSRELLINHNTRIGNKLVLYEMTKEDSVDIHTVDDIRLAQWYMNRKSYITTYNFYYDCKEGKLKVTTTTTNGI